MVRYGNQDYYMIGCLETNLSKVKIGKGGHLYFFLTPLCDFPNSVSDDVDALQIYASELISWGYTEDTSATEGERIQSLEEFLKDYLILCKPYVKSSNDSAIYYSGKEIKLKKKSDTFNPESKLIPLPIYNEKSSLTNPTLEKFTESLIYGKVLGRNSKMSTKSEDYPQYIVWSSSEAEDEFIIFGEISNQTNSQYGGIRYALKEDKLLEVRIREEDELFRNAYFDEQIAFIESDMLLNKIRNLKPHNTSVEGSIESDKNSILKTQDTTDLPNNEIIFMEKFISLCKQLNLYYEKTDLYNFHTAMKGDSLVILSGLSGTGKSQLVSAYAQALQLSEEQFHILPVRPFWQDDSDLIGYADTINSVYRPGDSGLVDILVAAQKEEEKLFLICFDEMNLAKVEHYFSQFLSILEMETGKRTLKLYNDELKNRLYNSSQFDSSVKIGNNVLFVGTINTDESTYQFSDKVLDRSNVISLKILPFMDIEGENNSFEPSKVKEQIKYEDFKSYKNSNPDYRLTSVEKKLFWELHKAINEADSNIGIGWRILKQIDSFLKNIPNDDVLTREYAIDLQLKQRVLTKVKGSEDQLSELIGTWNKMDSNLEKGQIEKILDKYSAVSDFSSSRKVLLQKAKELRLYGFTI